MDEVIKNRYQIIEKEDAGKCLSNGEKVKCYKYTYKDLYTGKIETAYGDKSYNEVVPPEDINNLEKGTIEINFKVVIGGVVAVVVLVAAVGGIYYVCRNPQVAARISLPLARKVFSVISKSNPAMIETLTKDIFQKTTKSLIPIIISIKNLYNKSQAADGIASDPIIFDLDGDGLSTTNIENGIYFDYENDGFKEASSWVGGNDGILFLDHNENQLLDNGSELISFNDLLEYDSNGDGVIDKNDEIYSRLKIQKADGTYLTVEEAGIISININTKNTYYTDENGNKQFASGYFKKEDGTELEFGAFMVETNPTNSYVSENITIAEDILELPYIDCYGKLYNLHQAMMKDETGELKALVEQFVSETNDDERMNLVDRILEKWANANRIDQDSRGEYINAKKLAVLEAFLGYEFYSQHEGELNPNNPNKEASELLNTAYENLRIYIYSELMVQSSFGNLYEKIEIYYNFDSNNIEYDLTNLVEEIKIGKYTNNTIYQVVKMLYGLNIIENSNFFDPKDDNCFYTTFTKDNRELKWLIDSIGKVMFNDEIGDGEGSAADDAFRAEKGENFHFHSLSGDDVVYGDRKKLLKRDEELRVWAIQFFDFLPSNPNIA